ncbi:MAG: hypothetical protein GXY86_09335 [Firmicutes bacterium]|nr:hypothetical protein [Bacillota bacterium]
MIQKKLSSLNRGWKRSGHQTNSKNFVDIEIPIDEAVTNQINEIKRIYEEEILGKLSEANRIYEEYRQNLYREYEIKEAEKNKEAKIMLEADLASEKERQRQALQIYYQELERKQQFTLINLELQKKMLVFNSSDPKMQQDEIDRIDSEITVIRDEIKKQVDERCDELNQEFERYQKQRSTEYEQELRIFRKTKRQKIKAELSRFRDELIKEFRVWNEQRRTSVEEAVELRRSQQK